MQCPKCGGENVKVDGVFMIDETSVEAKATCQGCGYIEMVTATFKYECDEIDSPCPVCGETSDCICTEI